MVARKLLLQTVEKLGGGFEGGLEGQEREADLVGRRGPGQWL